MHVILVFVYRSVQLIVFFHYCIVYYFIIWKKNSAVSPSSLAHLRTYAMGEGRNYVT